MASMSKRIKALEKKVAALETNLQAQRGTSIGMPIEEISRAVIKSLNQRTAEGDTPVLRI